LNPGNIGCEMIPLEDCFGLGYLPGTSGLRSIAGLWWIIDD
jgi:hypothetical protein